jgi:hypothetical protein
MAVQSIPSKPAKGKNNLLDDFDMKNNLHESQTRVFGNKLQFNDSHF